MTFELIESRLKQYFPSLHAALPEIPISHYQLATLPEDATIFKIGTRCEQYLLLTKGVVNVRMLSKSGKSIVLYRVKAGQPCAITTSCLLGNTDYPTIGTAQTEIEALVISHINFDRALNRSETFRQFVFAGLGHRLTSIMERIDLINFTSIDSRIASILIDQRDNNNSLKTTHELIAEEVGTAREVVSRHLKKLESKSIIELKRGQITLKDIKYLSNLCD